jgi:hypothetical protein
MHQPLTASEIKRSYQGLDEETEASTNEGNQAEHSEWKDWTSLNRQTIYRAAFQPSRSVRRRSNALRREGRKPQEIFISKMMARRRKASDIVRN